jgi:hypothetical protein
MAYENIVMEQVIAEIGFVLARVPKSTIYLTRVCRNAELLGEGRKKEGRLFDSISFFGDRLAWREATNWRNSSFFCLYH